jgi:hypothetical protein
MTSVPARLTSLLENRSLTYSLAGHPVVLGGTNANTTTLSTRNRHYPSRGSALTLRGRMRPEPMPKTTSRNRPASTE